MLETRAKESDVLSILNTIPGNHLILLPDAPRFTIVGATNAYLRSTYQSREETLGRSVFEANTDNPFKSFAAGVKNLTASLICVLDQKVEHRMADQHFDIVNPRTKQLEHRVWRSANTPVFDEKGAIRYIIHTVEDVSENTQLPADKKSTRDDSDYQRKLQYNLFMQAPVAITLTRGEDVIIESVNDSMVRMLNKNSVEEVLGKKMVEVLPEVENQPVIGFIRKVLRTGESFKGIEIPVDFRVRGKLETHYINLTYTPVLEAGERTGVLHVAIDVTEQVLARRKEEESRQELELALEIAELGTFRVDLLKNQATSSEKLNKWFGFSFQGYSLEEAFKPIHPDDYDQVEKRIQNTLQSQENSRHDISYRVIHPTNGTMRHLRSIGKTLFNEQGKPYLIVGIIQDITTQILHRKQLEESEALLQHKVLERTLDLEELNQELQRSNVNLEEFAYAASHDMKEPIRKIHYFADRLKHQLVAKLSEQQLHLFCRMEGAARRMSTLIDDLLTYSHINRGITTTEAVDLNQSVLNVLEDLELVTDDKDAKITIDHLPIVYGHKRQLQQLFENLIGNALKYSREAVSPEVYIQSALIYGSQTPLSLKGDAADKQYHLIGIKDHGIGFDPQDAERIFNVFTRLHGNAEYKGTGVGLSIARKVVENHNGYIWAESKLGEGATFNVLLPTG